MATAAPARRRRSSVHAPPPAPLRNKRQRRESYARAPPPSRSARHATLDAELVHITEATRFADQTADYSAGALIALRLINFQVATDSSFRFGPFLNMVLGSNGTGKSTIVNAIYLLFRGDISKLDRRHYGEFVQHGCDFAVVSAQLQGGPGARNPTLALKFTSVRKRLPGESHPKPQWYINGAACSEHSVDEFVKQFNIQVNNLCQFLPQFRVAAFSSESAQDRLISTEKAIGYEGMVEDHRKLATSGSHLSQLTEEVEALARRTAGLSDKRARLTERLQQLEAANKDKEHVKLLERLLRIAEYSDAKREVDAVQAKLAAAQQSLADFDADVTEQRSVVEDAKRNVQALELELDSRKSALVQARQSFESFEQARARNRATISDLHKRIVDTQARLETSQQRLAEKEGELAQQKLLKRQLVKQLNELGSDTEQFQKKEAQAATIEMEYTNLDAKMQQLSDEKSSISRQLTVKNHEEESLLRNIEKLRGAHNGLRSAADIARLLRDDNGNLERCVAFVNANQDRFEKPITMPAILSLNILDSEILPLFCESIPLIHLQKFVCQTARDQQTLTKLRDEARLDIRSSFVRPTSAQNRGAQDFDEPTMEKLRSVGIDGALIDKLDGPESMLNFMRSLGAHRVLYATAPLSQNQRDRLKHIAPRVKYADPSTFYSITQSRYGRKQLTELSHPLDRNVPRWARHMLKEDQTNRIRDLEAQVATVKKQVSFINERKQHLAGHEESNQRRLDELREELRSINSAIGRERALRARKEKCEKQVALLENKIREVKGIQDSYTHNLDEHLSGLRAEFSSMNSEYEHFPPGTVQDLQSSYYWETKQRMVIADAQNKAHCLESSLEDSRSRLRLAVEDLRKTFKKAQMGIKELHRSCKAARSWLKKHGKWEEGQTILEDRSASDLRDDLNRLNATVSLRDQETDSLESLQQQLAIIEPQLEEDTRKLEAARVSLSRLDQDTKDLRLRWTQSLVSMIDLVSAKFSEMFQQMGIRGSISLDRAEELAVGTWGVDINLAFRPEEDSLSKLSKFRQSGGERALATALYLLALQELATAPFRVLDEINQGMDEKNERSTLKFFVERSCTTNERSGKAQQYFLITPKLISNLPCHPNMNITYIYGGLAVGNTDKLLTALSPLDIHSALADEIESENEGSDDDDDNDDDSGGGV